MKQETYQFGPKRGEPIPQMPKPKTTQENAKRSAKIFEHDGVAAIDGCQLSAGWYFSTTTFETYGDATYGPFPNRKVTVSALKERIAGLKAQEEVKNR